MFKMNALPDADVRVRQVEDGRRLAAKEGGMTRRTLSVTKNKSAPKGHEAFLKGLELSGAEIMIEKCDGTQIRGIVKCSDKYTISVREELDIHQQMVAEAKFRDRVIFKHDISEFSAITPRAPVPDSKTPEGHAV